MRPEHWLFTIPLRLRSLVHRNRVDQELEEELGDHLEQKTEEFIAQGLPPEEARYAALREFGGVELAKENCRDTRGVNCIQDFFQDLRYGLRMLRKSPAFTVVAVLTLALGIGINSAMFSFVDAFLLRSLPVKDPQELVHVRNTPDAGFEQKTFEQLRERTRTLAGVIAWDDGHITAVIDGEASIVPVDFVSANFYSLLGVQAFRGRALSPDDDIPGKPAVAVISYGYWERRFGLDPSVIGKTLYLKDVTCTIVGISPPWFRGLRTGGAAASITIPALWHQHLALKDNTRFDLYGRLAKGTGAQQAQADLDVIYHQVLQAEAGKITNPGKRQELLDRRIAVLPAPQGELDFDDRFGLQLRILEAVVGLVLLLACINLANVLLARGTARSREIAVRLALGARRSRIVRQLLTENWLLAVCGGALGLLLSTQLGHLLLLVLRRESDTASLGVEVNGAVLGFTALLSVATALVFGLVPALRSSRGKLANSLRGNELTSEGKPIQSTRILVVPQIAISLVVLILAGLLLRSLARLHALDLGFEHDHLLTFWLMPTLSGYEDAKELQLYDEVLASINHLPGVRVASMSRLSLLNRGRARELVVDGLTHREAPYVWNAVGPRFFETLRVPFLLGRDFAAQDGPSSRSVAIINESAAKKYFAGQNPTGHRLVMEGGKAGVERTIVGVVKDMKFSFRNEMPTEAVYIPYAQAPDEDRGQAMIKLSTAVKPEAIIPAIRGKIRAVAKNLPAVNIVKEDQLLDEENTEERSLTQLLAAFGTLALSLTLLGLYGTVSYSVSRRIRELAIRTALGAQPRNLQWMILRESLCYVEAGAAAGVVLALAASRTVGSFLFGIGGFDAPTYAVSIMVLLASAMAAAYVPVCRVIHIDPMVSLRHD